MGFSPYRVFQYRMVALRFRSANFDRDSPLGNGICYIQIGLLTFNTCHMSVKKLSGLHFPDHDSTSKLVCLHLIHATCLYRIPSKRRGFASSNK